MEPLFDSDIFAETVIRPSISSITKKFNKTKKANDPIYIEFLNKYFKLRPKIEEAYNNQEKCFWVLSSIVFDNDRAHFNNDLNDKERILIKQILAFFASSDLIIVSKIRTHLDKIAFPDISKVYDYMKMMENIHSAVYQKLIEVLIVDEDEREQLYDSVINMPCIKNMSEWCKNQNADNVAEILFVNTIFEFVFFRSPFAIIASFKRRGLMPAVGISNEYISRDEDMHWNFGVLMQQLLMYPISEQRAHEITRQSADIYFPFIDVLIPKSMDTLDAKMIKDHFMYISDLLLSEYGFSKIFNVTSNFETALDNSLPIHTDFFGVTATSYGKIDVSNSGNLEIVDFY